jgi:hypothetical protein
VRSLTSGLCALAGFAVGALAVTAYTMSISGAVSAMSGTEWGFARRLADDIEGFTDAGPVIAAALIAAAVVLAVDRRTAARRTGWLLIIVSVSLAVCARFVDWLVVTAGAEGADAGAYVLFALFGGAGVLLALGARLTPGPTRPGLPPFSPPGTGQRTW